MSVDKSTGAILYQNDTEPGSSGAPIFNNIGQLVGIHARGEAPSRAFSTEDEGKTVEIKDGMVWIRGKYRAVQWGQAKPADLKGTITIKSNTGHVRVNVGRFSPYIEFENPKHYSNGGCLLTHIIKIAQHEQGLEQGLKRRNCSSSVLSLLREGASWMLSIEERNALHLDKAHSSGPHNQCAGSIVSMSRIGILGCR